MMLEEVLATFQAMPEEEVPSMIDLGYQLTVYAEEPTRSISSPAMSITCSASTNCRIRSMVYSSSPPWRGVDP